MAICLTTFNNHFFLHISYGVSVFYPIFDIIYTCFFLIHLTSFLPTLPFFRHPRGGGRSRSLPRLGGRLGGRPGGAVGGAAAGGGGLSGEGGECERGEGDNVGGCFFFVFFEMFFFGDVFLRCLFLRCFGRLVVFYRVYIGF